MLPFVALLIVANSAKVGWVVMTTAPARRTPAFMAVVNAVADTSHRPSVAVSVFVVAPVRSVVYFVNAKVSLPEAMPVTVKSPAYLMLLVRSVSNAPVATDHVPSDAVSRTFVAPVLVVEYVVEAFDSVVIPVTVKLPARRTPAVNAVSKVAAAIDHVASEAVSVFIVAPDLAVV